eukprot:2842475-Rhodomonas_salina.1
MRRRRRSSKGALNPQPQRVTRCWGVRAGRDRRLERTLWRIDNETRTTAEAIASRQASRQDPARLNHQDHLFPSDGAPPPYLPQ